MRYYLRISKKSSKFAPIYVRMILLLIILIIMTWTVTSKNSVSGDGELPYNVSATYSNTYQKGDVRQGDTAVIALTMQNAIKVERIDVYVKSNKTSGAGTFTVMSDGKAVSTKSGTLKEWTGSYDNAEYHAVTVLDAPVNTSNLSVSLVGSTNSLHIEKYEIQYAQAPSRTVTLRADNGIITTLTEVQGGAGVTLPSPPEVSSWEFVGWSETEFWEVDHIPSALISSGAKYYPQENCTLWAVYQQDQSPSLPYVTDLSSGLYMYVNSKTKITMTGVPEGGIMESAYVDANDEWQYYWVDFLGEDTVYITHMVTDLPIGYNADAQLTVWNSPWKVYHDGEETLFYAEIKGKNYVLWTDIKDGYGENLHTGLYCANPINSPMRLQSPLMPERLIIYTCHPSAQAIETLQSEMNNEYRLPIGNYQMIIRNGQKYMQLW